LDKKWDYCTETMDYNKVRKRVRELMYEELIEIRKIRDQEEKLVPVGLKIIATYEKIYNK
jgi:hypothetical protein